MRIVLTTGGFDPIHSGHIQYFKQARQLGDILVVGLNSDKWLVRKKGRPFMPLVERQAVVEELAAVNFVITFDDDDNTACAAIEKLLDKFKDDVIIFANGGDRGNTTTPEYLEYSEHPRVQFEFGVGGADKRNSSSWILEQWKSPITYRPWGWYRVLDNKTTYKVKELVINPGASLSYQRHFKRAEHWYVLKGSCTLHTTYNGNSDTTDLTECSHGYTISREVWHQAVNNTNELCHILEVQYGEECVEEDIERKQ